MKKLLFILLLAGTATCVGQRHPYSSRPYHPTERDRQSMPREARRPRQVPPAISAPKPQPVSVPAPKPEPTKRGK